MDMQNPGAPKTIGDRILPISRQIWNQKYRFKTAAGEPIDMTIEDSWSRVARTLASAERDPAKWEGVFYEALADFRFMPAGRIFAGSGTDRRVTLFNCFVMGDIEDDLASIFENLKDAALTMQQGGGIGYDFSTLRPKGAPVKGVGSDASGPLSFMDVWNSMCRTIMSAGSRRGAMMATMRCDHPDIEDFIKAKREPDRLRNFNLSVLATDPFMAAVKADADWDLTFGGKVYKTLRAKDLFDTITQATYDYAEPGVIFIDQINKRNNLHYCEEIHSTNPCVTAESRLATHMGMIRMDDLHRSGADIDVTVDRRALGENQTGTAVRKAVPVFMTSPEADVYKVTLNSGHTLRCTDWHEFYTTAGKQKLKDLQVGDGILLQSGKGQFGVGGTAELGLLLGLITADGHFTNRGMDTTAAVVSLWGSRKVLAQRVVAYVNGLIEASAGAAKRSRQVSAVEVPERDMVFVRSVVLARLLAEIGFTVETKLRVPEVIWRGNEGCVAEYLKALFECDGTVNVSGNSKSCSIRLSSSHPELLQDVQVLLGNFGVLAKIRHRRDASIKAMPDGQGGSNDYPTLAQHEIIIDGQARDTFMSEIGFLTDVKTQKYQAWRSDKQILKTQAFESSIESIDYVGREAVYDTTQPDENTVIFNGMVTGQCGEQPLPAYGACLLGSINLSALVRDAFTPTATIDRAELRELVAVAIRMMDNTIDVSGFPLEQQRVEAENKRRIGLGMTGLADALMMCRVRYGSQAAADLAGEWAAEIERAAYLASSAIAREKGSFPLYDEEQYIAGRTIQGLPQDVRDAIAANGIRNALVTSVAPTGTISLTADNISSGVEPVFALAYTRKVLQPDGSKIEEEVSDHALRRFRATYGDVELPDYFVTAQDLLPEEHIRMQAAVQRHVDSAISKTVNVPADIPFEDFQRVYLLAYESGCKGCTTYRPNDITGSILEIKPPETPKAAAQPAPPAVTPWELMKRPEKVIGATYKIKWPDSEHAMYVTVNDVEVDGVRRPLEVFVNSKNLEHYAWVVALTRMISAVFRRGGEVAFVAEELKQVFDPRGGQWSQGRYVPSLVAAIGNVLERHMRDTGFLPDPDADEATTAHALVPATQPEGTATALGPLCPKCSQPGLVREAGCQSCMHCGWSKCG